MSAISVTLLAPGSPQQPLFSLSRIFQQSKQSSVEMGDMDLFWDSSNNRVNIGPVLQRVRRSSRSSRLPESVEGSCHCGLIRFTVYLNRDSLTILDCNCSICSMKGYLHLTVPKDRVKISNECKRRMTTYRFGSDVAHHTFCSTCGVQPIYTPRSNPECYSVNVRCLDFGGRTLRITKLDGKNFTGRLHIG